MKMPLNPAGGTVEPTPSALRVVRVLVVDDSAFVRKVVREMLSRSAFIEVVGAARDGEEALRLADELKPDVVTCDLMMPQLDGVGFVREQMARQPLPILILTATPQDAELAMDALEAGAVDFVQKPTALATEELLGIREELVEKVRAAARAPRSTLSPPTAMPRALGARGSEVAAGGRRNVDLVL
ncbi:MAG TPA: response regulator, partial [Acidobacteriota bacterium]|nr:response regulator [Acidobacteriota bacterium]